MPYPRHRRRDHRGCALHDDQAAHTAPARHYYAKVGVRLLWLVDLDVRVLTAHRLESSDWRVIGTYREQTEARIAPSMPSRSTSATGGRRLPRRVRRDHDTCCRLLHSR